MRTLEVVAAVFRQDDKVLACRRAAGRASAGLWEFPGGKVEVGENPRDALSREIQEELTVEVVVGDVLDQSMTEVGELNINLACFEISSFSSPPEASTDHDELRWVTATDAHLLTWAEPDLPMVGRLFEYLGTQQS
ncbi:(deoxy)nucleoside triphosphate pyrophosphohydrolase [Herbiconiux sp. P16]|uniref:(deoxy)nucleoside triphosphate pyrophosphohydrolase n=1 Tax=Herbiconiux wuyangfengii TaxID=3342794 RepID=UPI0035BB9B66